MKRLCTIWSLGVPTKQLATLALAGLHDQVMSWFSNFLMEIICNLEPLCRTDSETDLPALTMTFGTPKKKI